MLRTIVAAVLLAGSTAGSAHAQDSTSAGSPTDPIVATVHRTHQIRQSDLDAWRHRHAPAQLARLRQELYEINRQAVDALVGEYLLAEAAAEHGISAEALIRQQLDRAAIAPVHEEEVREIYERSRSMMGQVTFDQAKSSIQSYLEEIRHNDARQELLAVLRAKAADEVVIQLEPPRYEMSLRGAEESFGDESAALTVVEYSDFQCPFCKRAAPDLRKLVESYPAAVRLVWRHFPLPGHDNAQAAAEAAACAGEQRVFWEYHDLLFANQGSLGSSDLRRHAAEVGLDMSQFNECVESHRYQSTVAEDVADGTELGISATPAIFINGRLIMGAVGYDTYQRVVEEELGLIRRQGRR